MKSSGIIFAAIIVLFLLSIPSETFGQTETLEGVHYSPPKGWAKTAKEGAAVYTDVNKTTNAFCILTIYGERPGTGDPQRDFANKWNELVVTPFKAESNPKTDSQSIADGWQAVSGGAQIDMSGVKALAVLTVVSGYGKTASVLA